MTAHVEYDDIPQTMRDLLDEVYLPPGVVIFWNSRNRMLHSNRPRDLWLTVQGRTDVRNVVKYLAGGAW